MSSDKSEQVMRGEIECTKVAMNLGFMYHFQEAKTCRTLSERLPRAKQDAGPNRHFAKQDAGEMAATISKIHSGESRP